MAKKVIYLDEESEQRWRKLFEETGRNASGWIQEQLKELECQNDDPYFLQKRIKDLTGKIQDLQIDLQQTQDKLKKTITITKLTATKLDSSIDYQMLKNMTKGIMQTYGLEQLQAGKYAKEYLLLGEGKPILQRFMQEKLKVVSEEVAEG